MGLACCLWQSTKLCAVSLDGALVWVKGIGDTALVVDKEK
jgi:hypothetical protein